ncbi:MAG TPA: NAD(P)/FAD-dependent oxidoreductase [Acidimicrobiia bacterium]|jgi:putative flavoprotein involved in K+ transport|nr:NAD(P)/FAD-dependent oxidoreductase [Acidimicrobiia bacterium]
MSNRYDTIVIGGGQTGLTVGHELAERGQRFLIIDASERIGDTWRRRWDSLVLFTPAGLDGLPGMPFPSPRPDRFVTKDEVADYLEKYAEAMELPVLSATRVERLSHDGNSFQVETDRDVFLSDNVVVAMANYQQPKVPDFAAELSPEVRQVHSHVYRSPSSLQPGPALVVGMGNSGAEIGLELARERETYVSGKPFAVVPFHIDTWFGRKIGVKMVRFMATKVLTTSTPMGRLVRPKMLGKSAPLVRVKPKDLVAAGAERVPRVVGARDGMPLLADGRTLDVANVVWCTGYRPGFDWIDLPVFEEDGRPRHRRGVVEEQPGLYFCGLFFQHALWSETLPGMPRDARYVVDHLVAAGQPSRVFH